MTSTKRREKIKNILLTETKAISASTLAEEFDVSRQIIVGDIALLRASGFEITATTKGYVLPKSKEDYNFFGKVACQHDVDKMLNEFYIVVDNGGELVDVIVEHSLYGELNGKLNISSRAEADYFFEQYKKQGDKLLSALTDGVHIHTIMCKDKLVFNKINDELLKSNILLS